MSIWSESMEENGLHCWAYDIAEKLQNMVRGVNDLWVDGRTAIYSESDMQVIKEAIELLGYL